jgi:predicted RND superfamily exporter protein
MSRRRTTVSILTSSIVLAAAGFAEGIASRIPAVSDIGILIGRGAAISAFVILVFLPSILRVSDRLITRRIMHHPKGVGHHA